MMKLLKPLETQTCPFETKPKTNERPHWVRPELVAQIKFTEWTADGKLRHPVYLGLRDDKKADDVTREAESRVRVRRSTVVDPRRRRTTSLERRPQRDRRTTNPTERRTRTANDERRTTNDERHRSINCRRSRIARKDGVLALPDGDSAEGHQPAQGVLAEAEADQGRPVPLLRRASRRSSCRPSPIGRS